MRIFLTGLLTVIATLLDITPTRAASETLHYVITYKWGLINKEAGDATLTMQTSGTESRLTLTARTRPWADKMFAVRDTLLSIADPHTLQPLRYVKSAHEGGRFSRDEIIFSRKGNHVEGEARRLRVGKKGERSENSLRLKAEGATFDMLSVFYYLRRLDYAALGKGMAETVNIFSGKQTERLTIAARGRRV